MVVFTDLCIGTVSAELRWGNCGRDCLGEDRATLIVSTPLTAFIVELYQMVLPAV